MTEMALTGGCNCGAVRYEITSETGFSLLCQCRRCQRATGTGHATKFNVARDELPVSGRTASYDDDADSAHRVRYQFCPACGSPLFGGTTQFPDSINVHAASLDDPSVFKPERMVHSASAQPWDHVDPSLAR